MNWQTITISQYQEIYKIRRQELEDIDMIREILYVLTGEDVDAWSVEKFNERSKEIAFVFEQTIPGKSQRSFKHNGKAYWINYDMSKISYGQYNEILYFGKTTDDTIGNLHLLMASIVTPLKKSWFGWKKPEGRKVDHAALAEELKGMPFIIAYQSCVFFYLIFRGYLNNSRPYLVNHLMETMQIPKEAAEEAITDLLNTMDGCLPQKKSQTLKA